MKKIYFLAFLFLCTFLTIGTNTAWGADSSYDVIFNKTNNSQDISSYENTWSNTTNKFIVDITNANNYNNGWEYIKMGSRSKALVGTITTRSKISERVTKVELTIDAITSSSVNSITLSTSSDGSTYTNAGTFNKSKGSQVVTLTSPTENLYYKITVNCKKGSSNGLITIKGVKYYYTTAALPKYTITWSVNGTTTTTQVTEGSAIGTLPADPSAPSGCSDKVFVGWTATNIGATPTNNKPDFITANTVPAGNITYYAVFAIESIGATPTKFAVGDVGNYAIVAYNDNAPYALPTNPTVNSGKIKALPITVSETNGVKYIATSDAEGFTWTIAKATSGYTIFDGAKYIYHSKGGSDGTDLAYGADGTTYTWSFTADGNYIKMAAINGTTTNNRGMLFNGTTIGGYSLSNWNSYNKTMILPIGGGIIYKEYVSECINCTGPATPLTLNIADAEGTTKDADGNATINIGQDGNAVVTFSTTGGNGTAVTYAVTPTTGATLNGTTVTFTQEGTFTLTASQTYTTTNGTTYCGGTDSKKIVITKTPTLYFTTIPTDPIVFGTVECGGNTPLENKQSISLRGYNLTGDVTVTVTGAYKIADTESAAWEDYATSLMLQKDAVSGSSASVYVISTPPMQSSNPTTGKVTFTTAGGNTLEVNLSTPIITCTEYTLTLNDRGRTTTLGNYYAGEEITTQPADPTGVCTEPINYVFDGWATAEVAEGSTTYTNTKVSFPYTMPAANTTLYAVYKYTTSSDLTPTKVSAKDIVDGGKYYITATYQNTEYMLKAGQFNATKSGSLTSTFDADAITEDMAWTFVQSQGTWSIESGKYKLGISLNDNKGLSSLENNDKTWTCTAVSTGSTMVKLTSPDLSSTNRTLALFQGKDWRAYNTNSGVQSIQLYKAASYFYTTSPDCSPFITGTQDITVTSGKDIWVEAVTPLAISAKNLDNNDDHAPVTITAESLSPAFTLKGLGTTGTGSASIELQTGYTQATLDAALTVVYKPTAHNMEEEGLIVLRISRADALATTYANETITVRGRSLPAEFVLAAKTADGSWVALPADLGTSSTSNLKSPYPIEVDETTNQASMVPETAIYSPANRSSVNVATTGIRFRSNKGGHLHGSSEKGNTNVWLSQQNWEKHQSWELRSTDLKDYSIRMQESEQGRYLSYDANQGKIGNYKNGSKLRILPIHSTCVRFDAPELNVQGLASTSVTLRWTVIAGANDYEYSTDGEKTWVPCAGLTTTATDDVEWTLSGLTPNQSYTLYIRAKVADGKTNCSVSGTTTFTTPTCDDVPTNLRTSVTANDVTITWNCTAATATVKIYSDAQGTTEAASKNNVSSPCKFEGLTAGTTYYYQVLAGGTCASAIAKFTTETADINIVEWEKDAVTIDINTDVDNVSIVVEKQTSHGTTTHNVADDLFFSKYYEATGNLKLLAIYNGTKDTLPLTNVKIQIGHTQWGLTVPMNIYGKHKKGYISPDEEIILWHKGIAALNNCVGKQMDVSIMQEHNNISFSGKASIGLFRADTLIDIIGAGTRPLPKAGTETIPWGDDPGWLGSGYDIENPTTEIQLSTNRCLLVRSNKVKSGRNAVLNNTTTFATLTKDEWLGRQVAEGTDNGVTESCNGFAYVADFNYNDYYVTYEPVGSLEELPGKRNPDGTFTIDIPRLDTMACNNFRVLLKKDGAVVASKEQKIPIIVYANANTENSTYFGGKLTNEICKTCDVVVRDKAKLTHTATGVSEFRDMYVYAGSKLEIPVGTAMTLGSVYMFALNDSVSYAIVNNTDGATTPAITIDNVVHIKRIDGHYWYPFSLPYDCKIADIRQINGLPLGAYDTDWGIKYYDGQRRQQEGNSATQGGVSQYWRMMPANGTLEAHKGYIIALFYPDESLMKSICFTPEGSSAYTENADSKTTHITNWPDNLSAEPRHRGWNFVGSPYISLFGSNNNTLGEGLYNTNVKMGYTDAFGTQTDKDHIYVSIPNGGNGRTYTQALASGVPIRPFSAYFVQAIDPTNGKSNTLNLTYSKGPRSLPKWAPARTAKTDALILTELDIANGTLGDNTGVLVSNVYSAEYEIGDDLTKMYAAAQKPQLYTIDAHNDKMAYQALPDVLAHAIPLGIYVPQAGNYTLSLNRYVSRLEAAEAVYLLHNGAVVANLLLSDYTVSASAKGTISGYSLDIRRAPEVVTDIVPAAGDAPYIIARDGVLAIANLPADAVVQVYDVLGHRLLQADTPAAGTLQVPVPQTGVYTVVITTADGQQVLKTLLR